MKKLLITISLLLFACISIYSQTTKDTLKTKDINDSITVVGNRYYQNNMRLSMAQISDRLSANPTAYKMVKDARSSGFLSMILSCAGGGLIGYPVGTAIGGEEPKWAMAGIGAGLLAIAIPIAIGADKKVKKAVRLYNKSLKPIAYQKPKTSFCIENTQNGIGIVMRF